MKTIGLVVGHHCDTALEIKAAILAKDASVTVLLDEGDFVEAPAPTVTMPNRSMIRRVCPVRENDMDFRVRKCPEPVAVSDTLF